VDKAIKKPLEKLELLAPAGAAGVPDLFGGIRDGARRRWLRLIAEILRSPISGMRFRPSAKESASTSGRHSLDTNLWFQGSLFRYIAWPFLHYQDSLADSLTAVLPR
jgi:hypothetical protein